MKWTKEINEILERFYNKQMERDGELDPEEKKRLTEELIAAYEALPKDRRGDMLVPAKAEFLSDNAIGVKYTADFQKSYFLNYRWPGNEGFDGAWKERRLEVGEVYDRIGGRDGRYLSPMIDGKAQTFLERAIPYYIPEEDICQSPAYHAYRVVKLSGTDVDVVRRGRIAKAFWKEPDDGGGTQIALTKQLRLCGGIFDDK